MERSLPIDCLRGLFVALMLLAAHPGDTHFVYMPLQNSLEVNLAALVCPGFLFVVGLSMWEAFGRYGRVWSAALGKKVLIRALLLFALGLAVVNPPGKFFSGDPWETTGILQKIALTYGLGTLLVLRVSRRLLLWLIPVLGAVHSGLMWIFHFNLTTEINWWLSCLPGLALVLIGWMSGNLMAYREMQSSVLVRDLLVYGLLLGVVGLFVDLFWPMNAQLWTASYVLCMASISIVLLGGCVWFFKVREWQSGMGFFVVFGANPLFAFLLSWIFAIVLSLPLGENNWNIRNWLYERLFVPLEGAAFSSFLFAFVITALIWAPCRWLYTKQKFLKI